MVGCAIACSVAPPDSRVASPRIITVFNSLSVPGYSVSGSQCPWFCLYLVSLTHTQPSKIFVRVRHVGAVLVAVSMSSRDSREDKRIFFWASVTTTTNLRVTRNTPRPKQFIDEADWAKYDVDCVGLTLYVYVLCIHVHTPEHTCTYFHACVCVYI